MAKPKITTNPAVVTLPSDELEWVPFTVAGTGLSKIKKAARKNSTQSYYMSYSFVPDAAGKPRDDVLTIWVTRQQLYRAIAAAGDTDNLDYTVTNSNSPAQESDPVTVIVLYD